MNRYLTSFITTDLLKLIVFGVFPLFVLAEGIMVFRSFDDQRVLDYQRHLQKQSQVAMLKAKLDPKKRQIEEIHTMLTTDQEVRLNNALAEAMEQYGSDGLERVKGGYESLSSEFRTLGKVRALDLEFSGRFEPMEMVSLDFERTNPYLFLNRAKLRRVGDGKQGEDAAHLEFSLQYTVLGEPVK